MHNHVSAGRAVMALLGAHLAVGCGSSSMVEPQLELGLEAGSDQDAGSDPTDAVMSAACSVQAPTVCPDPPPHYAEVAPIFDARCNSCHSDQSDGPWPLTDYQKIADWFDIVRSSVINCSMPPADAGVGITNDERLAILTWIRCGLPE
jgi:cytochrome c5